MKYLCLVHIEEAKWHDVPDRECIACGNALRESGKLIGGETNRCGWLKDKYGIS